MSSTLIDADASALNKALKGIKGIGNDENAIIDIIAKRTNLERQEIRQVYKSVYNKDLIKDFKHCLAGHFKKTVTALFYTPLEYDTKQLHSALKKLIVDGSTLIEIIVSRPATVLAEIKIKYQEMFNMSLEEHISQKTRGDFKKLLSSLIQATRSDFQNNEIEELKKIASKFNSLDFKNENKELLYKALAYFSYQDILIIINEYTQISGKDIVNKIESSFSGDLKDLLKAIIYYARSPHEFFARQINKSVKGLGTNDKMLIRCIVSRSEIDLKEISEYYQTIYNKSMLEDIKGDTTGEYKKLLIEFINYMINNNINNNNICINDDL